MLLRMLKGLQVINHYIEKVEYGLSLVTMALTTLITTLQVVMRYGFNHPFTWPEEVSTLLLVWMTFTGASILLKKRKHIEIDFFVNLFPKKWQNAVDLLNCFLMFCFTFVAAYGAYKLQPLQSHHYTIALRIPKSFFSLPVLIGGLSMCLFLFFAFLKRLTEFVTPKPNGKG